jgi:hypothetical protein
MPKKPLKGETRQEYIARCIKAFRAEGMSQEESIGRAYGFADSYFGKSKNNRSK